MKADQFYIEGGVPVPRSNKGRAKSRYPWAEMEPGDSFFVPEDVATQNQVSASGHAWCKRHRPDCKVLTRKREGGVRAWLLPVRYRDNGGPPDAE